MELISQHIRQILERNTTGCAKIEENCFFPFIYHQLQVCVWGICMSLWWVMNSSKPAGTPTTRLIAAERMFAHVIWVVFSTCCWGTGMEGCVRKGTIVLKPVGRTRTRERRLTVWSLMKSGQVLAGWLRSAVSWKTICWDDSIKGNQPARKPLVITQPASQAGRVQKEDTRERVGGREKRKILLLCFS